MNLGSGYPSTISFGAYSPVMKIGTGSTFYSLLTERKVYGIRPTLKGKIKIPITPKVYFL